MPVAHRLQERWSAWMAGGAICSEMEAAALYIVAATLHVRASGIMMIMGHPDQSPMTDEEMARGSLDNLLPAAIAGMREQIAQDRAAAAA
jgi:uridine phosphorylase